MNKLSLTELGKGAFVFKGRVDISNAGDALAAGQKQFKHCDHISVDVEQADCASTVGMALLLEWSTWSSANDKEISFINAPDHLIDMVRLNDIGSLLQLAGKTRFVDAFYATLLQR